MEKEGSGKKGLNILGTIKRKKLILIIVLALLFIYGVFYHHRGGKAPENVPATGKEALTAEDKLKADIEALKKEVDALKKSAGQENVKQQAAPGKQEQQRSLSELEKALHPPKQEGKLPTGGLPMGGLPAGLPPKIELPNPPRLIKIDIGSIRKPQKKAAKGGGKTGLLLPAGSFASFTLVSGAYAPATGEEMPVTGVLDKAFVGPNRTSIPLRGCLFLGKARGNIGEKMADIKVVKMTCTFPDSGSFETDTTGYITSQNGNFGLKGDVRRHAGAFFSTVGVASFLEGLTAGMGRAQEYQSTASSGFSTTQTTNVIGSAAQYGLLKGGQDLASAAKAFFAAQGQNLVPSVDVAPGSRGYVFLTSGVRIPEMEGSVGYKTNYYDSNDLSSSR